MVTSDVDDIDLFTGGLSEMILPGAATGPTFACIIATQFRHLKHGDRFWYENMSPITGFTEGKFAMTNSPILCALLSKMRQCTFGSPYFGLLFISCFSPQLVVLDQDIYIYILPIHPWILSRKFY